jgi:hypothetical protein
MAGALKIKITMGAVALLVLIVIPVLETNFFAAITIKRWSKLSWDDFQGIPKPLSSYEAAISSSVYLEFDSISKRYIAYAGQNNVSSWAKRSREEQDYTLNHEQYHFNITELHARMLNDYIEANPFGSLYLFTLRKNSLRIDLNEMQNRYDNETRHSLIYDKQRRWEYEIDSLLTRDKGWTTDHFSGGQVYFTQPPDSSKGISGWLPYRQHSLRAYGMSFTMSSFKLSSIDYKTIAGNLRRKGNENGDTLKSFSLDTTNIFKARLIIADTSNFTQYDLWTAQLPFLYLVRARFPNDTGDTTGYSANASSFLNSFRVVNTDDYWIDKLEKNGVPSTLGKLSDKTAETDKQAQFCLKIGSSERVSFHRGPFYREDGAMLLACDYVNHSDTLHFKEMLLLNDDAFSQKPVGEGQLYFIPAGSIPHENYKIRFGYTLLQDSLKECYQFYHESLDMVPSVNRLSNE